MGATPENVESLVNCFSQRGYQFSIYGYKFSEADRLNNRALRAVFRLAFVVHILTWNHDLRYAHMVLRAINEKTTVLGRTWNVVQDSMVDLMEGLANVGKTDAPWELPVDERFCETVFPESKALHSFSDMTYDKFQEFLLGVREAQNVVVSTFVNACGSKACLEGRDDLSEEQRNAWCRGVFLALKLLTRHHTKEPEGVWADQVVLAILRGLASEYGREVPVEVTYTFCGRCSAADARERLGLLCRISDRDKLNQQIWPVCEWNVQVQDIGEGKVNASAVWAYGLAHRPEKNALTLFVSSGLLRNTDDRLCPEGADSFPYLHPGTSPQEGHILAKLLARISQFSGVLAAQRRKRDRLGRVALERVRIRFEVTPKYPDVRANDRHANEPLTTHLEASFLLDGELDYPMESAAGSFWGAIDTLAKCFPFSHIGSLTTSRPGLYLDRRGDDKTKSVFRIVLNSGNACENTG